MQGVEAAFKHSDRAALQTAATHFFTLSYKVAPQLFDVVEELRCAVQAGGDPASSTVAAHLIDDLQHFVLKNVETFVCAIFELLAHHFERQNVIISVSRLSQIV